MYVLISVVKSNVGFSWISAVRPIASYFCFLLLFRKQSHWSERKMQINDLFWCACKAIALIVDKHSRLCLRVHAIISSMNLFSFEKWEFSKKKFEENVLLLRRNYYSKRTHRKWRSAAEWRFLEFTTGKIFCEFMYWITFRSCFCEQ